MCLRRTILILILITESLSHSSEDSINIICPKQCFCQYEHFMDLSITRWINHIQRNRITDNAPLLQNYGNDGNDNEVVYEGDDIYLSNPIIKQATCILQVNTNINELFRDLPHDVESLVILYAGGEEKNFTVQSSNFKQLNQLTTLEIRGPLDKTLKLLIDEPMRFLKNVNFESIQIVGSENLKRTKNPVHPSESFDYVPNSERFAYNLSMETKVNDDIEILPYEVYKMEIKKSRMPSFYGWEQLEVLRIHNCRLDEIQWEMFDGLTELQHLSLEENDLEIIPAFALYGAMHIKTLSLARNKILDLNYRSLAGLLELEILDLSDNQLTKLSELSFPPFPKLEFIDFRLNPIQYIFPSTFGIMNSTKIMFLGGSNNMELELTANNPFKSLELLKHLTIANASISNLEQNVFKGLKKLEILHLKGTILRIEFDAFVGLEQLRDLNLSNCNIDEISMDAFIGCKKLQIVDLSRNNLKYLPPGLFDDQLYLTEVYLNDNKLKFLPFTFITVLSPLKLIRLNNNPWKCSCDMVTWKPKITNRVRDKRHERCIKDFHTDKLISCKTIIDYKYDNQLSPRCNNLKNRSVYYALRKDLQCDFKKELEKIMKLHNHNSNNANYRRKGFTSKKNFDNRKGRKQPKNYHEEENKIINEINHELKKEKNQNHVNNIKNSLNYLKMNNNADIDQNSEMNNILGSIYDQDIFNNI